MNQDSPPREKCDLSIIIVNWNTSEFLQGCLASVQEDIALAMKANIETIVVDNGSADGSLEMVRSSFPRVKLLANADNKGFAAANNQGIRQSSGRCVLLLNSDTEVHSGALRVLLGFMEGNPRSGAAGARLLNADGTLQPACQPMLTPGREFWRLMFLEQLRPRATYRLGSWDTITPRRVDVIKGACLLLRREALQEVGLLDERYFMYTEEVDLCYRLQQTGWQLWYVPTAVVTHYGGASSSLVEQKMYLELYRSKIQFFRKTGGAKRVLLYKLLLSMAYLPRLALRPSKSVYRRLLAELPSM